MKATRAPGLAFAAAVLGALAGCAERPPAVSGDDGWGPSLRGDGPAEPVEGPAPIPRPRALPAAERERWSRAGELATLTQVGGRERSEHLDEAYDRTVLVDAAASGYAHLTVGTRFAPGALVVQRHHAGDEIVAYYAMERLAEGENAWRFSVIDPALRLAATDTTLCVRCHREAPFHGLFGPPAAP